jgi:hypothetical protein
MPFKSLAQLRWGHSPAGKEALGNKLPEWDKATKGLKLPARIKPQAKKQGGPVLSPEQRQRSRAVQKMSKLRQQNLLRKI